MLTIGPRIPRPIRSLPPYPSLALFSVPVIILEPVKPLLNYKETASLTTGPHQKSRQVPPSLCNRPVPFACWPQAAELMMARAAALAKLIFASVMMTSNFGGERQLGNRTRRRAVCLVRSFCATATRRKLDLWSPSLERCCSPENLQFRRAYE
jgi:hypothetical protein